MALSRNKIYCLGSAALIIVALCVIIPLVLNQKSENSTNSNNSTRSKLQGIAGMLSTATMPTYPPSIKLPKIPKTPPKEESGGPENPATAPETPATENQETNPGGNPEQMTPVLSSPASTLDPDAPKEQEPLPNTPEGQPPTQESVLPEGVSPSQDVWTPQNNEASYIPKVGENTPQQPLEGGNETPPDQQAGFPGDTQSSPGVSSSPDLDATHSMSSLPPGLTSPEGEPVTTAI